ncbi:hypothetical protein NQ315_017114 [Exocentrus adspersus]|uniref:Zinc finger MYND domain-containing protein 11 n=1 Tax=Exocentrus adspersus TaxID=1586481 RepID=A0AAV8VH89_9CUCU|nr:hypothetical protein NQ315_017114 [Exocentrus adspersus]
MPIRRHSDPINVKRIWDAIRYANQSRQVADIPKISKYLQSVDGCTPAQAELYIKQTLKDGLIATIRKSVDYAHQSFKIVQQDLVTGAGRKRLVLLRVPPGRRRDDLQELLPSFPFRLHNGRQAQIRGAEKDQQLPPKPPVVKPTDAPGTSKIESPKPQPPSNDQVTVISDDSTDVFLDSQVDSLKNGSSSSADADSEADLTTSLKEDKETEWVDKNSLEYDESLCSVCNINRIDYNCGLDKPEINYMLRFVLNRIRAWVREITLPHTITHTMAQEDRPEWLTDAELTWRANQLFFEHRDMSVIEVKLNTDSYNMFSDFLADVYTVQHNVAIFHGIESQEYGAAELMVRDAVHDISEMKNCVDCYKHSNEKINNRWFCLPCRVPHELVWAKQKGYPYWPAKVMKETATHYDVRFFGGKYERALLVKSLVKPITVPKESLQIKASAAFNKSCEELKYHQMLLNNPAELEKLKSLSLPRRRTLGSSFLNSSTGSNSGSMHSSTPAKTKKSTPSKANNVSATTVKMPAKRKSMSCNDDSKDKKKKVAEDEQNSSHAISGNVIDISDGEEDECTEYSFRENNASQDSFNLDETYEQVTSSTENFSKQISPRREAGLQQLDQPFSDSVEKMRRKLEGLPTKKEIIKCAMDCMQIEIDRITNDHNDHLKRLFESHNQQISETKKKQWCFNCEQDAIYHCCWNTAYCSQTCQQQHWLAEHKKVCRRKRDFKT